MSSLERLRAASLEAAALDKAANAAKPVEVIKPEPVPAPVAAAPATVAPSTAVAVIHPVGATLPLSIDSDEDVARAMAAFTGGHQTGRSLAELAAATDEGGGVREAFPFATLKKGSWSAYNKIDQNILDAMPVGNRAFRMVYLAHRLAAVAWVGSGDGSNKQPPIWAAAAPIPTVDALASEINQNLLLVSRKIQFTGADNRAKFDTLGRISPEVHIFGWTPATGYIVLVCSTYTAATLTSAAFSSIEGRGGIPIKLEIATETQDNPKATDPKKRQWDVAYVKPVIVLDEPAQALATAFDTLRAQNLRSVATECLKFGRGDDYNGLKTPELVEKLAQYFPLIK